MATVHNSPFSGSWYPEQAADLERLLDERFEESCRRTGPYLTPEGIGFVTPHAGPFYSGTVAAAVYRSLERLQPERIVLLAFPHHGRLRGVARPDVHAIQTPLGDVAIHGDFGGGFPFISEDRVCDHSFEIQLPFLQKVAPRARITPLYVGHLEPEARRATADELAAAWRPGMVFLASSDFTHYGSDFGYVPFPHDAMVSSRLLELDSECIDGAGSLDSCLFLDTLRENGSTVCGRDPIALLLDVLSRIGGDRLYQATLDYQTSGEITDDYRQSVSYAALGYFPQSAFELSAGDREALLDSAQETLRRLRETGNRELIAARGSQELCGRRAVFVSLHQGKELLGCVGNCRGQGPLAEEVSGLALAAALDDPRFHPAAAVTGPIDVEISVLTPFRRIRAAEQFQLGRHGALLNLGGRTGLLLPQVAPERDWAPEDFWRALARKSNLAPHDWRDPRARLSVFEAQVFARSGTAGS
jgi:AmmeMemoRadiSam system protein B/AmmeMemoRadiSam system protein A